MYKTSFDQEVLASNLDHAMGFFTNGELFQRMYGLGVSLSQYRLSMYPVPSSEHAYAFC